MTENWIYSCWGFSEDVSDSHLGHTENGHKKTVPRIRFVNLNKTLLMMSSNNVKIYMKNFQGI